MRIAVITGASSGMGKEFVLQLDAQQEFDELWLIARREDRLLEIGKQTRAKVRAISLDLCKREALDAYKSLLEEHNPDVAVLVNGSGFGRFGAFTDISLEEQEQMITLNASALMSMTYLTLPYMHKGGQIYQIDSQSAFQPVGIPACAVYRRVRCNQGVCAQLFALTQRGAEKERHSRDGNLPRLGQDRIF